MKIIFLSFYITIAPLTYGVELTLENIYKNDTFHTKGMGKWKWIPKSNDILIYDKAHGDSLKSFHRVEIGTRDTTTFISSEKLVFKDDTFNVSSFSFDKTGTKLLLLINRSNIWRHSYSGNYFVYDLFSEDLIQISDKDSQLKNVKFSLKYR